MQFIKVFQVLLLVLIVNLIHCFCYAAPSCMKKRYVLDIGSGSTKSYGALFDACKSNKYIKPLGKKHILMEYQNCLDYSHDGHTIESQCIEKSLNSIKKLKEYYRTDCINANCFAIATAWARNANNINDVVKLLQGEGLKIKVLSQKEEGELAFKAATVISNIDKEKIRILDMGGGSFQLSTIYNDEISVYNGMYGMYNYGNAIRKKFEITSDYANYDQINMIINDTVDAIKKDMYNNPSFISLTDAKKEVVGVGALLYLGMRMGLKLGDVISKEKLRELIFLFVNKTHKWTKANFSDLIDQAIPYAQSSVILLYSIMEAMNIDKVKIYDVNSADYVLHNIQDYFSDEEYPSKD